MQKHLLRKTIEKVSYEKLIHKLESHGIDNVLVIWIKGFLSNRKQRVVIGDNNSEWEEVTSSVPQGSVLGPILLTIFMNDLPEKLKNQWKLYADDSKLIGIVKDIEDSQKIQQDINKLQDWAMEWQMTFNYEKCKVMHFGKTNPEREHEMILGEHSSSYN